MNAEIKPSKIDSLQRRAYRIDSVVSRLSSFPQVGSEKVLDRHLVDLNGADYLSKLVELSEPEGILDSIKQKISNKTIPALGEIKSGIDNEIKLVEGSGKNLTRIQELVASGRLPESYLIKAEEEFGKIFGSQNENKDILITEDQPEISTDSSTITNPEAETGVEITATSELSDTEEEKDFLESSIKIDKEQGKLTFNEESIRFNSSELRLMEFALEHAGEWRDTLDFVEVMTGRRSTYDKTQFYLAISKLRKGLGDTESSPRFVSSGKGAKGGRYRFELPGFSEEEPSPVVDTPVMPDATQPVFTENVDRDPEKFLILPSGAEIDGGKVSIRIVKEIMDAGGEIKISELAINIYGSDNSTNRNRVRSTLNNIKPKLEQAQYQTKYNSSVDGSTISLVSTVPEVISEPTLEENVEAETNKTNTQAETVEPNNENSSTVLLEDEQESIDYDSATTEPPFEESEDIMSQPDLEPASTQVLTEGEQENINPDPVSESVSEEPTAAKETSDKMLHDPEEEKIINNVFLASETYALAKVFTYGNEAILSDLGITLNEEDIAEMSRMASVLKDDLASEEFSKKALEKKLVEFINNRQKVSMENAEDENVQFVLAALSSLENEEQIKILLETL